VAPQPLPAPEPDREPPRAAAPAPPPAAPVRRSRRRRWLRIVLRSLGVLVAIAAALLVASLTIDLGPSLRRRAEVAGSNYLRRPMHIGKLSIVLYRGAFEVDDLVIDGLRPEDRPFLKAKRLFVNMPWWSIFSRELIIENVDMNDWEMLVEQFPGGRHNFPRLVPDSKGGGKRSFTTTVRSVIARRGQFTYEDHSTPWSVVCRNLNVHVFRGLDAYRGTAQFSNGTVAIQDYEPFRADMQTRFKIDGGRVLLEAINLESTGASSSITGVVDLGHWPEMFYNVKSRVDFPIQKAIFFKEMNFTVAGHGDFTGTFHFFKTAAGTGRELKGTFTSPEAGVNQWRFPNVDGSLLWIPGKFEVTNVTTGLYGGTAKFDFTMAPLGSSTQKARAVWDAAYQNVDLVQLTDFLRLQGIRLSGRATGRNRLEWPVGRFVEKRGEGRIAVAAPPGMTPMTRELHPAQIARVDPLPPEVGPFNAHAPVGHVPVAGDITYALDPEWLSIVNGWAATEKTYVEFTGRTAWGNQSRIPFHVTSLDWQESDRLLAGILTAFGSPTGAVPVGGRGTFDGTMTESFGKPRIEGRFDGDRMRAWDVVWGRGRADLVIQNSYVTIAHGVVEHEGSQIVADGRFSLGYPRRDDGEEINATIQMTRRPIADLRHAFRIDDYPLDGVASGEYHLFGKYEQPFGYGKLSIDQGKAWGEPFDNATANLRFEGNGVRLESILLKKSAGQMTGAAWVGWDGGYSFNADATKIPVESVTAMSFPRAPLSGILQFNAAGAGTFASPRYDVKLRIDDLFAGDEGIGQVTGKLSLRAQTLTVEMDAASRRLSVTGSGRIALTPEMDTEATLRFSDTSLDPYIRFFNPQLSPFTTAVADGTIRVVGELADVDHLVIDASVDKLNLKLFDYPAHNEGPINLSLNQHVLKIQRFHLAGEGTALELNGDINLHQSQISVDASGDANLGILQAFFRDIRSSGSAKLHTKVNGPLESPVFSGDATISTGRFRYFALPHSVESIDGHVSFDKQGIRVDDVTAKVGGGDVRFGGHIGMRGYLPGDLDLTASGQGMRIRYPEGFRSTVNAELALTGSANSPLLSGNVTVVDSLWTKRFDPEADILALASGAAPEPGQTAGSSTTTLPLRFDIKIDAPPSSLRIQNNIARLAASADMRLAGTYDHPALTGRIDIDRGEIMFQGNRYLVTRGTIEFINPSRLEPVFDVEMETRIRVPEPGSTTTQTYRVTLGVSGTYSHLALALNSDPPLSNVNIVSLLLGNPVDLTNPELRQYDPNTVTQSQQQLLRTALVQVLTGATVLAPVNRAIESAGFDTVQIAPSVGTETDALAVSARLIIGKRISERAYLTFSRSLGSTTRDTEIILEYDISDRVGWVMTQSGDRTFAIEFRVRRSF
jgi:hypothetical protein